MIKYTDSHLADLVTLTKGRKIRGDDMLATGIALDDLERSGLITFGANERVPAGALLTVAGKNALASIDAKKVAAKVERLGNRVDTIFDYAKRERCSKQLREATRLMRALG